MKTELLLEYFKDSKDFIQIKDVICNFCNAAFEIRSLTGKVVFSCPPISNNTSLISTFLTDTLFAEIISNKTSFIKIPASNQQLVIFPIIYKNETIGIVIFIESINDKLTIPQLKTIISLLKTQIKSAERNVFHDFKTVKYNTATHQQELIEKVLNHIDANYYDPCLNLKEISKESGISYYYLSHLFKKFLKITFSNYLRNHRLKVASRMMRDQRLTLSEIAYECGFDDPAYFSRVFKKSFGISPTFFRAKSLSNQLVKS